ncbi:LOW QUALITY PROTEIN: uncharacterized protein C4orf54 homolog [Gymnodraco acuticeps]|uniref:LOW QUALITY PROTEIN: uncharacterized protein C4orf54 homolog n=1 Tax=Gymnodraco acuticeps TaxID=8218 RepID=A0A6P8WXZ5_GYMAC|nr:LOW QUALITY PROTEIN: uncharacterized protein C4orf54 homolog [Gymnodraco acuticeps]
MKEEQSCEETQATREVKDLFEKPAQEEEDAPEKHDEMKYVDVELADVNTGEAKLEKDCCFGEGNQMSVLINSGVAEDLRATEPKLSIKINIATNKTEDSEVGKCTQDVKEGPSEPSSLLDPPCNNAKSGNQPKSGDKGERVITQLSKTEENPITPRGEGLPCSDTDQWRSEDDYEEDDDVSLVLSYACVPCVTEDESHYITTHEIQLSELSDHEEDYDLGVASSGCWDIEDDYQVYSFVNYASFEGDEEEGGRGSRGPAAGVSTMLESDLCDAAKFPSSDESVSKPQQQQCSGNSAGQIHLSIRTTRAINDPSNIQEQGNILYHASRSGDTSRYVFRGVDGKSETLCDRAKCFIAAPGRLHFGRRLRGKEVTEVSSGASSAVSELDDADKEVRNLTAKSFKSLAYPYLDAINFSTTSESSSEHGKGINRWSTFVDLKYGNMNMSKGQDKSVLSHQNSSASFELAKNIDNRGYKGIALASIKPPTSKMFTLNGNPHSASSSTKQIELMGEFSKGHGGLITLTETLNFRCNVNSGMSEGEMHTNFAQNAAGSRSTDEVTNSLPSGKGRGASKSPCKTMEDTHKKAIFASSLIKNVISKKMQFEQERKMERGEIREAQEHAAGFAHQESDSFRGKGGRELHTQSSRFSESSSDYTIMCLDELGDIVDSGSCDTKSDSRRRDATASAPETNLDPVNEAGIDTKKGALEVPKSTLLRSQNSAFRCWKDEELEFQKDHKNDQTLEKSPSVYEKEGEGDQYSAGSGKLTKMSHLFVPSIQLLSSDGEEGQQLRSRSYSPYGDEGVIQEHSDNKLYIADSRNVGKSKSPEIKIKLRSFRENTTEHFGVSKLRAPNIGCNAANLGRTDDFKCHELAAALKGESSDKVPHFMVRDIRDNKSKLQTPIHQVRDVRKLVKSSYHFVSLDNNENKSNFLSADTHSEQHKQMSNRNPNSMSPIVIKCQSVNTNNNGKYSENTDLFKREQFDTDRSSPEGAKHAPLQMAAGRAYMGNLSHSSEGDIALRSESRTPSKKQEQIADIIDKKPESKIRNQGPLEKLQAAVKTMEQLYTYDKNEWKRKNESHVLADRHVLSMIASGDHGGPEEDAGGSNMDKTVRRDSFPNNDKPPPVISGPDSLLRSMQGNSTAANMFSLNSSLKAAALAKQNSIPFSHKSFVPKSPKLPVSLKICPMYLRGSEEAQSKEERPAREFLNASVDNENYLTIPVKTHASINKQASSADKPSVYTYAPQKQPTPPSGPLGSFVENHNQNAQRSSMVMDTRSPEVSPATIYHSLPMGMSISQPQVYCFSPAITPAPIMDPFQATQRKMLLDPTTGNYYLVDTPVQPATKRLFDPETGQYVDVPMPQAPMTPVPMPMSPLALSPGAYGHHYMIYPGLMSSPSLIPARTLVQSHMSVHSEPDSGDKALSQQPEGLYMESPFYMATGKFPHASYGPPQQAAAHRQPQGFSSAMQPLISISSQQGPRIIAPPSFDGTTMSFVVEHR